MEPPICREENVENPKIDHLINQPFRGHFTSSHFFRGIPYFKNLKHEKKNMFLNDINHGFPEDDSMGDLQDPTDGGT
jgi:hypothetical protein